MTPTKPWKVCIHWTAGGLKPSPTDIEHYHFVIDGEGGVHKGRYPIENNALIWKGKKDYARHCGGGNTRVIGVSLTGSGVSWNPPLFTRQGFEAMCKQVASLCFEYNIPINPEHVYTHYEFGVKNPKTSSRGKIDINRIPWELQLKPQDVGNYIRTKITWYYNQL